MINDVGFKKGLGNGRKMELLKNTNVNLLVTLDKNYLSPLTMMLKSYGAVHQEIRTDLYVAHSSLEENDFRRLENATSDFNIHIHSIKITDRYFKDTPVLARIPEESFYRLLAFQYLPESVERCLYLDPDIYILKSLVPLYETDFGDSYIAAAAHLHGLCNAFNKARLGLKEQKRYMNSGVVLMNLKAIRRDFTLKNILERLEENAQWLILGDQDLMNILFGSRALFIDERIYNLDERSFKYFKKHERFDITAAEEQTAIVHYNGKYKPWLEGYKGELNYFYPPVNEKGAAPKGMIKKQIASVIRITRPTKQQAIFIAGAITYSCLLVISYFCIGKELKKIIADPSAFRAWLNQFGSFDEALFILIRAVQTVVKFIPAEPLEIASGYAWGAVRGMMYCILGNMLGTAAVFVLTKHFGQKIIELFLPVRNMKTLSVFKSSKRTYSLFFLVYLIPGSPKDGLTYLAGLMSLKPLPYMLITAMRRIPSVLSSTLCGATLAEKQYGLAALLFVALCILALFGALVYRFFMIKNTEEEQQNVVS